jgi:hypothetical protein
MTDFSEQNCRPLWLRQFQQNMRQSLSIKPGKEIAVRAVHWAARAWRRAIQGNTIPGTVYLHAFRPFRYTLKHNTPMRYRIRRSALLRRILWGIAGIFHIIGVFFIRCFYFIFEPLARQEWEDRVSGG